MKKHLSVNIATLLSLLTAVLSCSVETPFESDYAADSNTESMLKTLIISGTATDIQTGDPIKEIHITLTATELYDDHEGRIVTKSTYTNNKGQFMITADGFYRPLKCILKAEDPNGHYLPAVSQEVMVSWKGTAYDGSNNMFFVNKCDFYMEKE